MRLARTERDRYRLCVGKIFTAWLLVSRIVPGTSSKLQGWADGVSELGSKE